MPSKKKKYNARFPAGRIKKIMQTDEEIGKVAQAVPVIISRTLELFVESLLTKSMNITQARNAKTLTPSHMKQCILSESRFDFLKDLVKNIPDPSTQEDNENNANEVYDYSITRGNEVAAQEAKLRKDIAANFYTEQSTSSPHSPVPQCGSKPKLQTDPSKLSFSIENLVNADSVRKEPPAAEIQINLTPLPSSSQSNVVAPLITTVNTAPTGDVLPMVPLAHHNPYPTANSGENNLYIDEDYDN